jgi:hypothetical protein
VAAREDDVTLSLELGLVPRLADAAQHLPARRLSLASDGTLTGPRDAVRELLGVTIDESGDRVSRAATGLLRGENTADELRATLAETRALLALYESI